MDELNPTVTQGGQAQKKDLQVGLASGGDQNREPLRISEMTFVEEKAAAFFHPRRTFQCETVFCINVRLHRVSPR
jgi:hypothetical protein